MKKGRELPVWYLNEPVLQEADQFYITAFWELSNGEPISWFERILYASRKGLDDFMIDAFSRIVKELDVVYQAWRAKQLKAAPKKDPNNG